MRTRKRFGEVLPATDGVVERDDQFLSTRLGECFNLTSKQGLAEGCADGALGFGGRTCVDKCLLGEEVKRRRCRS